MNGSSQQSTLAVLPLALAISVALVCFFTDLFWRRIPNLVSLSAVFIGLVLGFANDGWKGLGNAASGALVGCLTLIVPYLVGGMGAGDVKMMGALGALMGPSAIVQIFLYTALIGGVISIANAIWNKSLVRALRNIWDWTSSLWLQRMAGLRGGLSQTELAKTAGLIPYGVAISLGLFAYLAFGRLI